MTAYYNEFDPKAAAGLRALIEDGLIPPGEVDTRSIIDVRPDDLRGFIQCHFFAGIGGWSRALDIAAWPHDRPVWTGSCPCQPFSSAGKQKGGADDRDLWPVWFKLISECRPAIVFGEQVASAIPHGWLDRVYFDMEAEGYACGASVLPACAVNAPHRRDRLWYVANAEDNRFQKSARENGKSQPREIVQSGMELAGAGWNVGDTQGIGSGRWPNNENQGRRECTSPYTRERACQNDPPPQSLVNSKISGSHEDEKLQGRCSADRDEELPEPVGSGGFPLVDAIGVGGCSGDNERKDAENAYSSGERSNGGFWDDHEWIVCGDGKARRIPTAQSGIRLLAHGISERVGLLRAGGNAIVPEEAARFIKAAREVIEA